MFWSDEEKVEDEVDEEDRHDNVQENQGRTQQRLEILIGQFLCA